MIQAFSTLVNSISPSTGGVYESARLNDNLDGTGGITLSWNSATNNTIPVGTSVVYNGAKYMVLEPYAPQKASATPHYRYEVTFQHPLARLARVPFYIKSKDSEQHDIDLHTSTFTGYVQTIAQKLADFFTEYGAIDTEFGTTFGTWTTNFDQLSSVLMTTLITVDFDGCSIRSAATRIADAVGCNVFFDWSVKTIRFISGTTVDGEYYNCFRVLGGTRNMAKKTVQGLYAAVTQRLTLDSSWPGSMMYRGQENDEEEPAVRLTRDLIFDDIYPKMELFISSARARYCYLTDEDGNKIVDHYEKNGSTVPASTEGATPVYKLYCKWYVRLRYGDAGRTPYEHDQTIQIADKPLCLLFQPDYANLSASSPLAGREFEVVYFENNTEEWEDDDVLPETSPFVAQEGEFRIIFGAEGETILPSLALDGTVPVLGYHLTSGESLTYPYLVGGGLCPQIGNKVTLTNVAVEAATDPNNNTYKAIAQEELHDAALEVIALMDNDNGQYQYQSVTEIPAIGTQKTVDGHTGVVTAVSADLDTGVADITIGSWSRKTLTGGVRDKIDSVSATGKGETENDRIMSKGSFDTLMRTVKKSNVSQEVINTLGARIDEIAAQADAQFNVIFGVGDPTTSANPPEENWTDTEKELHLQDIYYDMNTEAASTGGRAWRWEITEGVYGWEEITDLDTILSLQKIADVAGDGVLSGGAEKTRVFIEWKNAADEFNKILTSAGDYGVSTAALSTAYWNLWQILNNGVAKTASDDYNSVPSWLSNLTQTTRFTSSTIGTDITIGGTTYTSGTNISPAMYKDAWNDFYAAYAAVSTAITGQTQLLVASKISYYASYNVPTPPYTAGAMWFKLASQNQGETNGVLYQCINSRPSGTGQMSDWKKVSNFGVSIGSMLATLYSHWEEKIKQIHDFSVYDEYNSIPVYIQNTEPTRTYPMVWFNPSNGTVKVWYDAYEDETITASGSNSSDATLISLFTEIYNTLGEFTFNIWNYLSDEATLYDIFGKRSSFKDSFTKQDIEGELSVWMKGENAWTQVLDNTEGILQNYGDHIVAAIYGVSATTAQSMATQLTLAKNFAQLMAQASQETDSQTGESVMKDVAGIRIIADEHEDPNDDTSPITKGHVEIVGKLVSADGNFSLTGETSEETITWDFTPYPTSRIAGLHMGGRYGGIIMDYNEGSSENRAWGFPVIRLKSYFIRGEAEGEYGGEFKSRISAIRILSNKFGITRKVYGSSDKDDDGDAFSIYPGIDGSFVAKDSNGNDVTVTVMGGIITDIS